MWGFVVDKAALGRVFSEYFGFPCQSSFHHLFSILIITLFWHNKPLVAEMPSGLNGTPPTTTSIKKKF
jgi:hypothetical protein